MKDVLGGKGAAWRNVPRRSASPLASPSHRSLQYLFPDKNSLPKEIEQEIAQSLAKLEAQMGKKLGDAANPMLLSVRSGAKFFPCRHDEYHSHLDERPDRGRPRENSGNRASHYDCYRRFIQMFGEVASTST